MKIKNKRELVLRAQYHARHDHVKQGTYGIGRANGQVEFQGCAIGCLAAPHRKKDLRDYVRAIFDKTKVPAYSHLINSDGSMYDPRDSDELVAEVGREFGLTPRLLRAAEDVFEGLIEHADAIDFIPAFAKALPEGARITDRQVAAFRKHYHWDAGWDEATQTDREPSGEAKREQLLGWLRSRDRSAVTA